MYTKTSGTEERVDERTRRAATESMTTIALGSGEFKVYSGTRKSYVVNLITETCECPSAVYQPGPCKHLRRTQMAVGEREIPDLGRHTRTDVEIMTGRSREAEPAVATDGGQLVETPRGESEETGWPDDCDCTPAFCDDELGCWPCYRDGFESANPAVEDDEEVSD